MKLIHSIYLWSSDLRRRKQHLDSWLGKEALLILSYHLFLDSSCWQLFYYLWAFLLDFIDKRLFLACKLANHFGITRIKWFSLQFKAIRLANFSD